MKIDDEVVPRGLHTPKRNGLHSGIKEARETLLVVSANEASQLEERDVDVLVTWPMGFVDSRVPREALLAQIVDKPD